MALLAALTEFQDALAARDTLLTERERLQVLKGTVNSQLDGLVPLITAARARVPVAKAALIAEIQGTAE